MGGNDEQREGQGETAEGDREEGERGRRGGRVKFTKCGYLPCIASCSALS